MKAVNRKKILFITITYGLLAYKLRINGMLRAKREKEGNGKAFVFYETEAAGQWIEPGSSFFHSFLCAGRK